MFYQRPSKTEINEKVYRIANLTENHKTVHYCQEYLAQQIRQYILAMSVFETKVVVESLIEKGALELI